MQYFHKLDGLPAPDLASEFDAMMASGVLSWDKMRPDQICLNSTPSHPDDLHYGSGSLFKDWGRATVVNGSIVVPARDEADIPREQDFTVLNSQFRGTQFETVYNSVATRYQLGRVRIMQQRPKTCMSWHQDDTMRIHYPMKTQYGCMMVIEDEVKHLNQGQWWFTNTLPHHTAVNASMQPRTHLVFVVIRELS